MNQRPRVGFCAAMVLALGAAVTPFTAKANLITNGSFESPVFNGTSTDGNPYYFYGLSPSAPAGWSMTGPQLIWFRSRAPYWMASDGNQYIEISSGYSGDVYQSFATQAGAQYTVSFDYAPDPLLDATSNDDSLNVLIDGVSALFVDLGDTTVGNLDWTSHSFNFTAASTLTELRFADGFAGLPYRGSVVDNVSVTAVVDTVPGAMSLAAVTLWLFALRLRREV